MTSVFLATLSSPLALPNFRSPSRDPLGTDQGLRRDAKGIKGEERLRLLVPGCKVPPAASLCIALPGRCGAWGSTLCSVSLPSWFPEVDSEARILGRPVVLLSLYLRIRQDGRGALSP